jgi:hypothetical protein
VETRYGFAKADPGAAIEAADELARRYAEGSMRRVQAEGTIDLVGCRGTYSRRFFRHRVEADGTSYLVDESTPPAEFGFDIALMVGGAFVFVAAILIALAKRSDDMGAEVTIGFLGFIAGLVGIVRANRYSVEWYVRDTFGTDTGWRRVVKPTTWAPGSFSQMATVERLADEHRGKALVRREADGSVTTLTLRRGRMIRHRVTADGGLQLISEGSRPLRYVLGASLIAVAIFGGILAICLHNFTEADTDTAWNVCFGIFVAGAVLCGTLTIEGCVKREGSFDEWHLVQTKPDDPD